MPNTGSASCPYESTFAVFFPSRMSMGCPAPNDGPPSRDSRTSVESSFCAATVPSQTDGGDRHVSQFPHGPSWRLPPQRHWPLPAQHLRAQIGQRQRPVVALDREQPGR